MFTTLLGPLPPSAAIALLICIIAVLRGTIHPPPCFNRGPLPYSVAVFLDSAFYLAMRFMVMPGRDRVFFEMAARGGARSLRATDSPAGAL